MNNPARQFLVLTIGFLLLHLPTALHAVMIPKRAVLGNGLVLLTSDQRTLPMVSIELLIDAGARYDGANREGLANLTARLLTYGTNKRSALQISEALDFVGASLSTDCGDDLATISMT